MKNFAIKCAAALALTSAAAAAFAQPSISTQVHSSGVIIRANNTDSRNYTCVINYEYVYDSFGTTQRGRVSQVATAVPGQSVIHQLQGSYVNLRVPGGVNVTCN